MKRTWMSWVAAGVLIGSQGAILLGVWQNRSGAPVAVLELTERELPLMAQPRESTVVCLEWRWRVDGDTPVARGSPSWLSPERLGELGFDCRRAATDPDARDHYAAQPPRPAWLVLELRDEAGGASGGGGETLDSRLVVVAAGRSAGELRGTYPDAARFVIVRGLVGVSLQTHAHDGSGVLQQPVVRGWIRSVEPGQLFVPLPWGRLLEGWVSRVDGWEGERKGVPRYAVRVAWGQRFEPWVTAVRTLPADGGTSGR